MVAATIVWQALFENYQNLPGALVNFDIQFFSKAEVFLGANFFSAYNTSTGASKYFKIPVPSRIMAKHLTGDPPIAHQNELPEDIFLNQCND